MEKKRNPSTGALVAVLMLATNGCAVVKIGEMNAPPRLPAEILPPLTSPVVFDVCLEFNVEPPSAIERQRLERADDVQAALARAGVPAELTSTAGAPADFTVTYGASHTQGGWSMVLSFLTLSIVPGYFVESGGLYVDLVWVDGDVEKREHFRYVTHTTFYIWLPLLLFHPDLVGGNGGWSSDRMNDRGFEQSVARIGDDVRARLGRDGARSTAGVACPKARARGPRGSS
jgi:hypothetical protein